MSGFFYWIVETMASVIVLYAIFLAFALALFMLVQGTKDLYEHSKEIYMKWSNK